MTDQRIFVQIASYRDTECQWTIKDLFDKAENPVRVFVGVCWQFVADEDADCFEISTRPDQVRTVEFDASESQGTGWARGHSQALWRGEEYLLQIDSHMRFVENWDSKMIAMLTQCPSPNPILTTYPPGYVPPNALTDADPAKLCFWRFHDSGDVEFATGGGEDLVAGRKPSPCIACAGGFQFAPARLIEQVPCDPHIFFIEEMSFSARLWTNGWDFYAPNEVLLYHYYGARDKYRRHDAGRRDAKDLHRRTAARNKHLLGVETSSDPAVIVDIDKYGLGTTRTLREYEEFSGINFAARTIAHYARAWPYYLTAAEKSRRDTVRENPALGETAHSYLLGDGGIIFSEPAQEIYHFNRAAMFIWCSLEEGETPGDIVTRLAESLGISTEDTDTMLTETLRHWWDLGLLASNQVDRDLAKDGLRQGQTRDASADVENFPEDDAPRHVIEHRYEMLGVVTKVLFETPEQEAIVHPIVAYLETTDSASPVDSTVTVIRRGEQHFAYVDDVPKYHYRDISALAPMVKGQVALAAVNSQDYFMCLHSGVVSDGDTCIMFPGESGRGKSSMTAAFVKAGFQYCSDEAALLKEDSFEVTPAPVAMCIKETAFDSMATLFPRTTDLPSFNREDGKVVRYFLPPDGVTAPKVDAPMPVKRIIFPNYDPDRSAQLENFDKSAALKIILSECMAIPTDLDAQSMSAFVTWFESIDCYQLTVASIEDTVAVATRMLEADQAM
jgi:hypothetical protein